MPPQVPRDAIELVSRIQRLLFEPDRVAETLDLVASLRQKLEAFIGEHRRSDNVSRDPSDDATNDLDATRDSPRDHPQRTLLDDLPDVSESREIVRSDELEIWEPRLQGTFFGSGMVIVRQGSAARSTRLAVEGRAATDVLLALAECTALPMAGPLPITRHHRATGSTFHVVADADLIAALPPEMRTALKITMTKG